MSTILRRRPSQPFWTTLRGGLLLLLIASIFSWTGCSGGSSTGESAAPDDGQGDAAEPEESATADAGGDAEESSEPEPPGEAPFDTTFLDARTELFIFARVGDILDSPLVQTLTGGNLGPLYELEQHLGISPEEIDTVTVGVSQLAKLAEESAASMPNFGPGPRALSYGEDSYGEEMDEDESYGDESYGEEMDDEDYGAPTRGQPPQAESGDGIVVVVRTKAPIDMEQFEGKAQLERVPHKRTAYYRVTAGPGEDRPCLYLHDGKTLIASDEATIKEVIDQGEQRARPTADLGFVESAPHFLFAVAPKDKAELIKTGSQFSLPGGGLMPLSGFPGASPEDDFSEDAFDAEAEDERPAQRRAGRRRPGAGRSGVPGAESGPSSGGLFEEHLDAFALLIDLSEGIGLNVAVKCDTADAAQQMLTEIDSGLDEGKTQFEAFKSTLPGVIRLVAQPMMDSLAASAAEAVVTVSLALPEEQQSLLPMLPAAMMGMMMRGMDSSSGGEISMLPSLGEFAQEIIFDGQPAANAGELPEGLEFKALARWGASPYGEEGPPPLEIGVVAVGGPAGEAVAFGQLKLADAQADETTSMKWTGTLTDSFDQDPVAELLAIERDGMFSDHPESGVVTGFVVSAPVEPIESLSAVVGEITFQIAGNMEDVTIADVRDARPGGSGDGRLAEIGASVKVANRGGDEQLEMAYDESPLVGKVEPVGPDGLPIETAGSGWSSSGGRKTLTFGFGGKIPAGTGLRVTLYSDLETVAVPFRFENLPLPEPQELTDEQQALLVWTRAEPPEGIDDLVIEAQGRWRTLERVDSGTEGIGEGFFGGGLLGGAGGLSGRLGPQRRQEPDYGESDSSYGDDESADGIDDESYGNEGQRSAQRGGFRQFGSTRVVGSEQPLQIVIDLIGPLAQTAEGLGFIDVSLAKSDIDTDLAFEGAEFGSGFGDPTEEFVNIDRDLTSGDEHPPGGLRVVLKFTPPNQPIQSLARLNGLLKFRTVRERTEAIIKNLQSRVGAPISNRELAKFRIKPVVEIEGNRLRMVLVDGKDDRISEVIPIDLNDHPITDVIASTQTGGAQAKWRTIYVFEFPGGVPERVGLKYYLNMGVEEITVPIRIRDLPLPPMPAREE